MTRIIAVTKNDQNDQSNQKDQKWSNMIFFKISYYLPKRTWPQDWTRGPSWTNGHTLFIKMSVITFLEKSFWNFWLEWSFLNFFTCSSNSNLWSLSSWLKPGEVGKGSLNKRLHNHRWQQCWDWKYYSCCKSRIGQIV